jgi:TonB family protein
MKTLVQNDDLILRNYGAAELKAYSAKATYNAFGITLIMTGIIFLLFFIFKVNPSPVIQTEVRNSPGIIEIINYKTKSPDLVLNMPMPNEVIRPAAGTEKVIANPVPIKVETINESTITFASTKDAATSASTIGTAKNVFDIIPSGNGNNQGKAAQQLIAPTILDDEDEFIIVDKEPEVDLVSLQKSVVYPELARKVRVEGKVLVRALIGLDGKVIKAKIDMSDNLLLDEASLKAVMTPGIFKPALQHNNPVLCWISIPINFRLR